MRVPFTNYAYGISNWTSYDQNRVEMAIKPTAKMVSESVTRSRRHKPKGFLNPLPYSFNRVEYVKAQGTVTYKNKSQPKGSVYSGFVGGGGSYARFDSASSWSSTFAELSNASFSASDNIALIKVRLKAKDSTVNYGQALAERNQTARLLGDTCHSLVGMYRALRKGDADGLVRIAGKTKKRLSKKQKKHLRYTAKNARMDASARWLEIQYGWRPFMDDIWGSIENLGKQPVDNFYYTEKGSCLKVIDHSVNSDAIGGSYGRGTCWVKGEMRSRYIVIGLPRMNPGGFAAQMGLSNPALLAWELTPFSFVVDWALPIGDYLDSLDAMLNFEEKYVVLTRFGKIGWVDKGNGVITPDPPSYLTTATANYTGFKNQVFLNRSVSAGLPYPQLPRLKDPSSFTHMANGLALLVQIFGGGKTRVK